MVHICGIPVFKVTLYPSSELSEQIAALSNCGSDSSVGSNCAAEATGLNCIVLPDRKRRRDIQLALIGEGLTITGIAEEWIYTHPIFLAESLKFEALRNSPTA